MRAAAWDFFLNYYWRAPPVFPLECFLPADCDILWQFLFPSVWIRQPVRPITGKIPPLYFSFFFSFYFPSCSYDSSCVLDALFPSRETRLIKTQGSLIFLYIYLNAVKLLEFDIRRVMSGEPSAVESASKYRDDIER